MTPTLLLCLSLLSAPNGRVTLFGDIITSYRTIENDQFRDLDGENFRFEQADLGIHYLATDWASVYSRMTLAGASVSVSEAYVKLMGLPLEGSLTVGRFYKPLGSPIPLSSLSFPVIAVHSSPEFGAKLNLEKYPWVMELGVVNGNPISLPALSSRIAGTAVFSNNTSPITFDPHKEKDYYSRVGVVLGEDWGSLNAGVSYTFGELARQEVDYLNPGGAVNSFLYTSQDLDDRREHLGIDLDFQKGPYRLFGEYVDARDGRAHRKVWSAAGSYTWYTRWGPMTTTAGFDKLEINADRVILALPQSWSRDRVALSHAWWPQEFWSVQAEYDWNGENVSGANPGGDLDNDVFTIQSILYF